jgi:tetratricopeptide (TPR) repeat protein
MGNTVAVSDEELDPILAEAYVAYDSCDYEGALRLIVGIESDDAELLRANSLDELGRREEAEEIFSRLAAGSSLRDLALRNLGIQARESGQHDAAAKYFDQAFKVGDEISLLHLAESNEELGNLDAAEIDLRLAVDLGFDGAEQWLGVYLLRQGDYDAALPYLHVALLAGFDTSLNIATAHWRRGETDLARALLQMFSHNGDARALLLLADLLSENDNSLEAEGLYQEMVERKVPGAANNYGAFLRSAGRLDEARRMFRMDPTDPLAQRNLRALDS